MSDLVCGCAAPCSAPVVRVIAGDGGKIMKGVMKIEEAWNLARVRRAAQLAAQTARATGHALAVCAFLPC